MAKAEKRGTEAESDDKRNTSLRLSKKTLKALKIRAIEEETSVQKIVEQLIEAYLKTSRKKD
ncbi:MAG: ribbon-helix-helix protein, CopG family [Sedimentitalea sp.]|uniref:ribbon-helix-helix protein, CopG family n=1 Tax=Sedimentitalea sp. TaxID=2048915 RepID=UPI0032670F52